MPKRTPDNCKYIRCCGEPGRDSNGKCMGFGHANNDEPIELCKRCVYCTARNEEDQDLENKMAKIKIDMEHGIIYECPECGGEVEMRQSYCQDCGEPLEWVEDFYEKESRQ